MLVSAVISLEPMGGRAPADGGGRAAHAWFLDRVRAADAGLATQLHEGQGRQPFTVALRRGRRGTGERWLRLTTLTGELSALVVERLLPDLPDEVELMGIRWRVTGATTERTAHPWAGRTGYRELAERHLLSGPRPGPWLRLAFATPTSFHSRGRHLPLPVPHLAVEGWLGKWNAFAPLSLNKEALRFAEEDLAIGRYRLRTVAVRMGKVPIVGFVGQCDYRFVRQEVYRMRVLHLLASYAFYCGTGHKTTMGLGQTMVNDQ